MPPAGFETAIPAIDRPQYYALDCAATGIGGYVNHQVKYSDDSNNDSDAFKGQQVGFRAAFEQINSSFYCVNGTLDHRTKLIRLPAYKPSDRSSVRIAGGCGPMSTEVCLLSPPCFILHSVVSVSYSPVNSVNIISINNTTDSSSLWLLLDMLQCSLPSTVAQTTMLLTYS